MNNYKAFDDQGILAIGSFRDCCNEIVKWAQSEEASSCYSEEELCKIINFFSACREEGDLEYFGFSVQETEVA